MDYNLFRLLLFIAFYWTYWVFLRFIGVYHCSIWLYYSLLAFAMPALVELSGRVDHFSSKHNTLKNTAKIKGNKPPKPPDPGELPREIKDNKAQ
jgi:hypothetical protein